MDIVEKIEGVLEEGNKLRDSLIKKGFDEKLLKMFTNKELREIYDKNLKVGDVYNGKKLKGK